MEYYSKAKGDRNKIEILEDSQNACVRIYSYAEEMGYLSKCSRAFKITTVLFLLPLLAYITTTNRNLMDVAPEPYREPIRVHFIVC